MDEQLPAVYFGGVVERIGNGGEWLSDCVMHIKLGSQKGGFSRTLG